MQLLVAEVKATPGLLHRWHSDGSLCVGDVSFSPQLCNSLRLGVELDALFAVAVKVGGLISRFSRKFEAWPHFQAVHDCWTNTPWFQFQKKPCDISF